MEHMQRVWLASRERLPFRTPDSVPHFGLAIAPIVETIFLELAMSLLDFSPRIPLGTFSILLCIPEPGRPDCVIFIEIGVNGDAYPVAINPKVTKNLPVSFYSPTSGFKILPTATATTSVFVMH